MKRELEDGNREPGTGNREGGNRESGIGNREFGIEDDRFEFDADEIAGFAEDGRAIRDHRDLDVWKLGVDFATEVYRVTSTFPADEKFGLISQLRRAAVSIPLNIAEGYGRETSGSYIQFLRIAQGSAKEIQTLIEISARLGLLKGAQRTDLDAINERLAQMLFKLIRAVGRASASSSSRFPVPGSRFPKGR